MSGKKNILVSGEYLLVFLTWHYTFKKSINNSEILTFVTFVISLRYCSSSLNALYWPERTNAFQIRALKEISDERRFN